MRLIDPDKGTVPAESDLGADKCSIPQLPLNSRDRYTTMLLSCQGFCHSSNLSFGYSHSRSMVLGAQRLDLARKKADLCEQDQRELMHSLIKIHFT